MVRGHKNPLYLAISKRLLKLRRTHDLGQREIARSAGLVPQVTLGQVERGVSVGRIDTIEKIAASIGVSPCWLAYGDDGGQPFAQKISRVGDQLAGKRAGQIPAPAGPQPYEDLAKGCGGRLADLRKSAGLSLRELSEHCGISFETIRNIEAGTSVPKVDSIFQIAVALDCAPCWLAYGIGKKPPAARRAERRRERAETTADAAKGGPHGPTTKRMSPAAGS